MFIAVAGSPRGWQPRRTVFFQEEVSMIEDNPIPQLVIRYRNLARQRKALDAEMTGVKAELQPLVEASDGKWKDNDGYARIITRKPSLSYDSKSVEALAQTWSNSDDAVMKSCGEMLLQHRREKNGFSYLQVK